MFKPTNPKCDILTASLKEVRDKKQNIDNEISELPFIISEVDDLEKEIEEMECDISSLIEQKEEKTKRLSELQSKLVDKNKTQLQEESILLEKEIQDKEVEIQNIIESDDQIVGATILFIATGKSKKLRLSDLQLLYSYRT